MSNYSDNQQRELEEAVRELSRLTGREHKLAVIKRLGENTAIGRRSHKVAWVTTSDDDIILGGTFGKPLWVILDWVREQAPVVR